MLITSKNLKTVNMQMFFSNVIVEMTLVYYFQLNFIIQNEFLFIDVKDKGVLQNKEVLNIG